MDTILPSAGIAKPRSARYQSLDLWRGIACLLVVVNHASFLKIETLPPEVTLWNALSYGLAVLAQRMWIGVPIFFVISGYCISATADATRRRAESWTTYFKRRLRRIYPPYWCCLVGTIAVLIVLDLLLLPRLLSASGLYLRPWWYGAWQWVGNITLTETWRYHFVGNQKALFLGHAWTLCYEEQFYVVMGLILMCARQRFFQAVAVITLLCLLVVALCDYLHIPIDGFFFDGTWLLFACGIVVYFILNHASRRQAHIVLLCLLASFVYSVREPASLLDPQKNMAQSLCIASLFALGLIVARPWDSRLCAQPWLWPLFACGRMCYSLYLVHLPVILFMRGFAQAADIAVERVSPLVTVPLGLLTSLGIAWLFFILVERRFLNTPSPVVQSSYGTASESGKLTALSESGR